MRNLSQSGLASSLFISGLVLLATFANTLVFSAFPFQLLRPDWQLRMAGFLIPNGITALLGVVLVAISEEGLSSGNSSLLGKARLMRRLAGWAAIGYLILIPAQISAGLRQLGTIAQKEKQPAIAWGKFRGRMNATQSVDELRALLSQVPEIPPVADKLEAPFASVKKDLISYVDARFAARATQLQKARSERLQIFLAEALRNTIQCLLLAAGFSAVSRSSRITGLGESPTNFIP
jgi:hypothetical protein